MTTQISSLVLMSKAEEMLAKANTIQELRELKNLALTVAAWAQRKTLGENMVRQCQKIALRATKKLGEMLAATERAPAGRPTSNPSARRRDSRSPALKELGISYNESAEAQKLASLPAHEFQDVMDGKITKAKALITQRNREMRAELDSIAAREAKAIQGVFDVVVIDPPWPMAKIERDCAPNQSRFLDYPTMSEAELQQLRIPYAANCHIWLWTTQSFFTLARELLDTWGLEFGEIFVWKKPGGFQVVGHPQYNCEFALYARRGHPKFLDTKAFSTCFDAPRGRHSEKPDKFYEMVSRVTAGRRLDMFARKPHEGFEGWGNESA